MEAGAIPNPLQESPAAITRRLLHHGGECRQRIQAHDEEPVQPGPSE
jgi:hypothetical protein